MTEKEWFACTDPRAMLNALKTEPRLRKWRLLGVALVRTDLPWHHLGDRPLTAEEWETTRPLLEAVEARADEELAAAALVLDELDFRHALDVSEMLHGGSTVEQTTETRIIRDLFGNPFRPAVFAPEWRTDTAVALATQMYESRCFDTVPILADALQDAGCDSDDVLNHCRAEGVHVRGCWVVDLVLGKA